MLRNGRTINNRVTCGQQDRIRHKCTHERIQKFIRRVALQMIVVRHMLGSSIHQFRKGCKQFHSFASEQIEFSARLDRFVDELAVVVPALGALHLKLCRMSEGSENCAQVTEHFLGTEIVALRIVDLRVVVNIGVMKKDADTLSQIGKMALL